MFKLYNSKLRLSNFFFTFISLLHGYSRFSYTSVPKCPFNFSVMERLGFSVPWNKELI